MLRHASYHGWAASDGLVLPDEIVMCTVMVSTFFEKALVTRVKHLIDILHGQVLPLDQRR
jgi:hypothetical protein